MRSWPAPARLALLVVLFAFDWLTVGGVNQRGWHAIPILRWVLLVTALTALMLAIAQATRGAPGLPVALSTVVTVLGTVSTRPADRPAADDVGGALRRRAARPGGGHRADGRRR